MVKLKLVKVCCIYCKGTGKKTRGTCRECDGAGYYFRLLKDIQPKEKLLIMETPEY